MLKGGVSEDLLTTVDEVDNHKETDLQTDYTHLDILLQRDGQVENLNNETCRQTPIDS